MPDRLGGTRAARSGPPDAEAARPRPNAAGAAAADAPQAALWPLGASATAGCTHSGPILRKGNSSTTPAGARREG